MRPRDLAWTSCIAAFAAVIWPARATACTCATSAFYHSEPEVGATDVAQNQAVVLTGHFVPETITFEDADGAPVAFDATHGPAPASCPGTISELVPREPLQSKTTYVIRASAVLAGKPDGSVTFTTGTGMLEEVELTTPRGRASVMSGVLPSPLCGNGGVVACVGLDDHDDIEVIARRDGDVIMRWLDAISGKFELPAAPDCIELRRRSATGKRSKPFEICGEALKLQAHGRETAIDEWGGVACDDGRFGAEMSTGSAAAPDSQEGFSAGGGPGWGTEPDASADRRDSGPPDGPTVTSGAGACSLSRTTGAPGVAMVALLSLFALSLRRIRRA